MESLSNELLLNVASNLPQKDLCALALVSKQMSPIAQDQLYRSPSISTSPYPGRAWRADPVDNRLCSLLLTLTVKPELANMVRQLEFHPQDRLVFFDYSLLPNLSADAVQTLRLARHEVAQCALIGMILERTENLEVLVLERLANRQGWRHKYDPLRYDFTKFLVGQLFGSRAASEAEFARGLSQIKGLKKLKQLSLNSAPLDFSWCMLPSLTILRLGRDPFLEDTDIPVSLTSTVHTMELEVTAKEFSLSSSQSESAGAQRSFLSRFTSLKRLTINVCNTLVSRRGEGEQEYIFNLFRYDERDTTINFTNYIISRLTALASELEHLDIIYHKEEGDVGRKFIWNVKSATFTSFTKLKTLTVPLPFLISEYPDAAFRPADGLPTSLEQLTVTHVEKHSTCGHIPLLESISTSPTPFSKLAKICLCSYQLATWDFGFQAAVKALVKSGVEVVAGDGKAFLDDEDEPKDDSKDNYKNEDEDEDENWTPAPIRRRTRNMFIEALDGSD